MAKSDSMRYWHILVPLRETYDYENVCATLERLAARPGFLLGQEMRERGAPEIESYRFGVQGMAV
jgi:hypothetical protein